MMNCISPDFKNLAFYKLDVTNNKEELLIRSMKGRWSDFCTKDSDINKKVQCNFKNLSIIRYVEENKENKILKSEELVNFKEYQLVQTTKTFDKKEKNKMVSEKQVIYKCKKIRI